MSEGEGYLLALRTLGLIPQLAGWGWDDASKLWQLVLVTSVVDAGGPLALNKLLFRAYNANATPKAISPFMVRIYSPEIVSTQMWLLGSPALRAEHRDNSGRFIRELSPENLEVDFAGLSMEWINTYEYGMLGKQTPKYHERREAWERFKRNVEKLAA